MNEQGWIGPEDRDESQTALHNAVMEMAGTFGTVGSPASTIPDRVIYAEHEVQELGMLLPRTLQTTGSCVGASGGRAYQHARLGDLMSGVAEGVLRDPFWLATYGMGRKIAGARGTGDGSFGSAQAKAIEDFGLLMMAFNPELPLPTTNRGWSQWTAEQEYEWSHPDAWPLPEAEVESRASDRTMGQVTRVTSTDQLVNLLAQCFGCTVASQFGSQNMRVFGDVLIADWNATWSHQMSCSGYWQHPREGLLFLIDNQWGPNAHPSCPTLSEIGVSGSFWVRETTMGQMCRTGEVFGHTSATFHSRNPWSVGL